MQEKEGANHFSLRTVADLIVDFAPLGMCSTSLRKEQARLQADIHMYEITNVAINAVMESHGSREEEADVATLPGLL